MNDVIYINGQAFLLSVVRAQIKSAIENKASWPEGVPFPPWAMEPLTVTDSLLKALVGLDLQHDVALEDPSGLDRTYQHNERIRLMPGARFYTYPHGIFGG